jgi:hypothetical protein
MSAGIRIRHVVSIAGAVQDRASQKRLGGALVQITGGPPAFQTMLAAQAADPAWQRRRQRLDQALSQADGIFTFLDLPPGPYRLRISAPEHGSRYGIVEMGPVQVQPAPDSGPVPVVEVTAALPPTRIHGTVTEAASGNPLPGAAVRLLGDTAVVKTGDDGTYELSQQIAGRPALQVTAARFQPATRRIELVAGQERVEDFALQPE